MKWIVPIAIIGILLGGFLLHSYSSAVDLSARAEAEAYDVVAESVAQVVCVVGRGNAINYGDYRSFSAPTVVLSIADIPLDDWENVWFPYIENKYTQAGIPIKLRWVDTSGVDNSLEPTGLGDHIYTLEVYFEKLKVYRYWRIGAIYMKISNTGNNGLGQYRCITIKY